MFSLLFCKVWCTLRKNLVVWQVVGSFSLGPPRAKKYSQSCSSLPKDGSRALLPLTAWQWFSPSGSCMEPIAELNICLVYSVLFLYYGSAYGLDPTHIYSTHSHSHSTRLESWQGFRYLLNLFNPKILLFLIYPPSFFISNGNVFTSHITEMSLFWTTLVRPLKAWRCENRWKFGMARLVVLAFVCMLFIL